MDPISKSHEAVARAALARNRADLAEIALRKLLEREPRQSWAMTALSACLRIQYRFEEALQQARYAVSGHPNFGYAHFTLAAICAVMEHYDLALVHALEAVRLTPGRARYYGILANVYHETYRFEEALRTIDDGLRIEADNLYLKRLRGVTLASCGSRAAAEQIITTMTSELPSDPMAFFCAGWALWILRESDRAIFHLREALRISPNSADTHAILGLSLYQHGEMEQARIELQEALRLNPYFQRCKIALEAISQDKLQHRSAVGILRT